MPRIPTSVISAIAGSLLGLSLLLPSFVAIGALQTAQKSTSTAATAAHSASVRVDGLEHQLADEEARTSDLGVRDAQLEQALRDHNVSVPATLPPTRVIYPGPVNTTTTVRSAKRTTSTTTSSTATPSSTSTTNSTNGASGATVTTQPRQTQAPTTTTTAPPATITTPSTVRAPTTTTTASCTLSVLKVCIPRP